MIFDYTIETVGCIKTLNVCYHVFGFAGYHTMKPETANRGVVKLMTVVKHLWLIKDNFDKLYHLRSSNAISSSIMMKMKLIRVLVRGKCRKHRICALLFFLFGVSGSSSPLTHWDRDKKAAICLTTFLIHFVHYKSLYFDPNFTESSSQGPINNTSTLVQVMARRRWGNRQSFWTTVA